jgi:hypothetical protein
MKCPSCGAEVGVEDVFCGECGSPLPRKGRKLALPIIIGAVIGVLVLGVICVGGLAVLFWPTPTPTPGEVARVSPTLPAISSPTPTQVAMESPTPTRPPIPTVMPVPTVPSWSLAVVDDFDDPESGFWEGSDENRRHFYQDGRYGIEITQEDWSSWSWRDDVFSDLVMEVDVIPQSEAGEGGVIFRREGSFQFYQFNITPDGQYRLRKKVTEEDWEEIIDWRESPHIRTDLVPNRLRVVCVGPAISLYVNGRYLDSVQDTTFTEGKVGLAAGTFDGEPQAVFSFGDLRVWAPMAGPAVLFEDDFSDPDSGWEVSEYENGNVGYSDGGYAVTSLGDGWWIMGLANRSFDDLVIEVDATQISAPDNNNNGYGIVCRVQPNGDGYLLGISGDGFYSIYEIMDGEFEALVEWAESDVIYQRNATNRIRAVCDGSDLALFVNGELLAEANDSTFIEGDIGLTATSYEDEPTEIHFDNLVVFAALGE